MYKRFTQQTKEREENETARPSQKYKNKNVHFTLSKYRIKKHIKQSEKWKRDSDIKQWYLLINVEEKKSKLEKEIYSLRQY